jgi:hypothetical protein
MILFGKKKVKPSQKAYAVVTGAGSGLDEVLQLNWQNVVAA